MPEQLPDTPGPAGTGGATTPEGQAGTPSAPGKEIGERQVERIVGELTGPRREGSFGFATYARGGQAEGSLATGPEPGQHLHHRGHPPTTSEREALSTAMGSSEGAPRSELRFQRQEGGPAVPGQAEWTYLEQQRTAERGAAAAAEAAQWWGSETMQTMVTKYEVGALPEAADYEFAALVIKLLKAPKSFNIWDELRKEIWYRSRVYRLLMMTKGLPQEDQSQFNLRHGLTAAEALQWLETGLDQSFRRLEDRYKQVDLDDGITDKMTDQQKEWRREQNEAQNAWREELRQAEASDLEDQIDRLKKDWETIKQAIDNRQLLPNAELIRDEKLRQRLKTEVGKLETGTLVPGGPTVLSAEKLSALLEEAIEVDETHTARVSIFADFQTKETLRASSEGSLTRLYGPGRDAPTAEHLRKAVERGAYKEGEVPQRLILREAGREWINIAKGEGVVPWTVEELDRVREVKVAGARAFDRLERITEAIRQGRLNPNSVRRVMEWLDGKAKEGSSVSLPAAYIEALVRMEDGEYRTNARAELLEVEEGIEKGFIDPDRIKKLRDFEELKKQALIDLPPEVEERVAAEVDKEIEDKELDRSKRDDTINDRLEQLAIDIARHWWVYGSKRIVIGNPNHPDSISHLWGNPQKGGDQRKMVELITDRVFKRINLESVRINRSVRRYNERLKQNRAELKQLERAIRERLVNPDDEQVKQRRAELKRLERRLPLRMPRRVLGGGEKWRVFGEVGLAYAILMITDEYARFMPFGVMLGQERVEEYGRKFISMLMAEQRGMKWDGSDTFYTEVEHPEYIQIALRRGEYNTPLSVDVHAKNGEYGVPVNLPARQLHKLKGSGRPQSDLGPLAKAGADFNLLVPMLEYYHLEYDKPVRAIKAGVTKKPEELTPEDWEVGAAKVNISIWDLMEKYGLGFDEAIAVLDTKKFKDPRVEGRQEMDVKSSEILDIESYRNTSAHAFPILQVAMTNNFGAMAGNINLREFYLKVFTDHMTAGPRITWQMRGLSGKRVFRSKEDGLLHWIDGDELLEIVTQMYLGQLVGSLGVATSEIDATDKHRTSDNPVDSLKTPMIEPQDVKEEDYIRTVNTRLIKALIEGHVMAKNVPVFLPVVDEKGKPVIGRDGKPERISLFEASQALVRTYLLDGNWRLSRTPRAFQKPLLFKVRRLEGGRLIDTTPWIQWLTPVQREFLDEVVKLTYPLLG